jgi:hypothetical protein
MSQTLLERPTELEPPLDTMAPNTSLEEQALEQVTSPSKRSMEDKIQFVVNFLSGSSRGALVLDALEAMIMEKDDRCGLGDDMEFNEAQLRDDLVGLPLPEDTYEEFRESKIQVLINVVQQQFQGQEDWTPIHTSLGLDLQESCQAPPPLSKLIIDVSCVMQVLGAPTTCMECAARRIRANHTHVRR